MYFDLNFLVPPPSRNTGPTHAQSNKGKGKQFLHSQSTLFSQAQLEAIEARIDLLVHLGYSVFAFNQSIKTKFEPKTFVNTLDPLLHLVKKRPGIIYLKRLTIALDEDSEKGFGLTNAHSNLFTPYDIIALAPTTEATFSLACLTHTQPSPLSAHIISVPLDVPRLPFRMKHTMVRTALRNGAVFEIPYASALDNTAKRNWWAAAREVVRVTKGKGLIVTGGGMDVADLRAPRDVGNLCVDSTYPLIPKLIWSTSVTFLGLAQDMAHNAATTTPKSLVLRARVSRLFVRCFLLTYRSHRNTQDLSCCIFRAKSGYTSHFSCGAQGCRGVRAIGGAAVGSSTYTGGYAEVIRRRATKKAHQ
ncbi:RNase P subunit p30-domain-containing protein [Lactarius vividus]|nr:RNase P subunit p30-domain-containing protein [Lactarius vividus]